MRFSKRIVSLLLIISLLIPTLIFAQSYDVDTYIVILDMPAVYSPDRPVLYNSGSENLDDEYRNFLLENQAEIKNDITGGISFFSNNDSYSYTDLINGFTMQMTSQKADKVRQMSGVLAVIKDVFSPKSFPDADAIDVFSKTDSFSRLNSASMINAESMYEKGYSGKERVIAIIDSELDINHTYFKEPEYVKYSQSDIENLIKATNFSARFLASDVYRSKKIPFAYNYALSSPDVQPSNATIHGTHVTGIAAGSLMTTSDGSLSGVAPDAQILFFSVFGNGGTNPSKVLMAMEDASKFDIDAINLSLGSDYMSENYNSASSVSIQSLIRSSIKSAENKGISVVYASGNSGNGSPSSTNFIDYSCADNSTFPYAIKAGAVYAEYTKQNGAIVQAYTQPTACSFSSYGYSDLLDIAIDFSAPGGSIYSSYPSPDASLDQNAHKLFAIMSGTSMASPQISGAIVLLSEYIEDTFPEISGIDKVNLIRNLLASTAQTVYDSKGTIASVRQLGSGLIDLNAATNSFVYLTSTQDDYSKITLKELSGNTFEVSFTAHNLSKSDITFDEILVEMSTDDYIAADSGFKLNGLKKLTPTVSGNTPVIIPANSKAFVTLSITLSDDDIEYLKKGMPNGFWVDGKVSLKGNSLTSVGIPFTGFYGDWEAQPIISDFSKSLITRATYSAKGSTLTAHAIKEDENTYSFYKSTNASNFQQDFYLVPDRNSYDLNTNEFYNKSRLNKLSLNTKKSLNLSLDKTASSTKFNIKLNEDNLPPSITFLDEVINNKTHYTSLYLSDSESALSNYTLTHDGALKTFVKALNSPTFTVNIPSDYKNASLTLYDSAFNETTIDLGVKILVEDNICKIQNHTSKALSGALVLATYDNGKLLSIKTLSDAASLKKAETLAIANVSAYKDTDYKIFYWNASEFLPYCEPYTTAE